MNERREHETVQKILAETMRSANNGFIAAILIGVIIFVAGQYMASHFEARFSQEDRI